jgi:hypothetical protein
MIPTKNTQGARRQCVGPNKYKYNFLSRYIINIFLYQNKSAGDSEIYICYRDRGILMALKITLQCHLSFGTGGLKARGQGGAVENEESKVMGSCLFVHAADER